MPDPGDTQDGTHGVSEAEVEAAAKAMHPPSFGDFRSAGCRCEEMARKCLAAAYAVRRDTQDGTEREGLDTESAARHELWMARRDAFTDCLSDYERLRGYVNRRYGDTLTQREVNAWMADNGYGLFVEGVPEADALRERFWPVSKPKEGTDA